MKYRKLPRSLPVMVDEGYLSRFYRQTQERHKCRTRSGSIPGRPKRGSGDLMIRFTTGSQLYWDISAGSGLVQAEVQNLNISQEITLEHSLQRFREQPWQSALHSLFSAPDCSKLPVCPDRDTDVSNQTPVTEGRGYRLRPSAGTSPVYFHHSIKTALVWSF